MSNSCERMTTISILLATLGWYFCTNSFARRLIAWILDSASVIKIWLVAGTLPPGQAPPTRYLDHHIHSTVPHCIFLAIWLLTCIEQRTGLAALYADVGVEPTRSA